MANGLELFNEEKETVEKYGKTMMRKWDKALSSYGGIRDQHLAMTTAIVLENYMQHLNGDPSLIMEDQIQSNSFQGVNLALLGLIRRTIPEIIGAELVGMQAMPTPESPIFYLIWEKSLLEGTNGMNPYNPYDTFGNQGTSFKGQSSNLDELWATPLSGKDNLGQDPFYTSSQIRDTSIKKYPAAGISNIYTPLTGVFNAATDTIKLNWLPVVNATIKLVAVDTNGAPLQVIHFDGVYGNSAVQPHTLSGSGVFNIAAGQTEFQADGKSLKIVLAGANVASVVDILINWDFIGEANPQMPEMTLKIQKKNMSLIRRQLRGRFTLDSAVDAKVLHGISLDNELYEMMKIELTNEINREIVRDLRLMAGIRRDLDYNSILASGNISGNYDDFHKFILDAVNVIRAEIWNVGRLGHANWVLGNPVTLSFLDRVPGFIGSGVNYDATRGLSFAGSIGSIKFYRDPQYPKNELLIGYKGPSALDTGYIHAPYLPITATPTMYNNLTGDPVKVFYTRYSKTYRDIDPNNNGKPSQALYRGEYQYAVLTLKSFPQLNGYSVQANNIF